jgi:hypothetical protein
MPATKNINAEKIQGILSGVTSVSSSTISGSTGFFDSISATTYQNIPPSRYVTGFTYSSNTFTITDSSGTTYDSTINVVTGFTVNGDLIVTGNTTSDGFTANTISASTYLNIPSYTRREDFVNPYWYGGFAIVGTSESSPTWQITRVEYLSGGTVDVKHATGAWTNRYSLIYT